MLPSTEAFKYKQSVKRIECISVMDPPSDPSPDASSEEKGEFESSEESAELRIGAQRMLA